MKAADTFDVSGNALIDYVVIARWIPLDVAPRAATCHRCQRLLAP